MWGVILELKFHENFKTHQFAIWTKRIGEIQSQALNINGTMFCDTIYIQKLIY